MQGICEQGPSENSARARGYYSKQRMLLDGELLLEIGDIFQAWSRCLLPSTEPFLLLLLLMFLLNAGAILSFLSTNFEHMQIKEVMQKEEGIHKVEGISVQRDLQCEGFGT